MPNYEYKIELQTEAILSEEQQNDFLLYIKYKMDNIAVVPEKIAKKINILFEMDEDLLIVIKKFKIEDEI